MFVRGSFVASTVQLYRLEIEAGTKAVGMRVPLLALDLFLEKADAVIGDRKGQHEKIRHGQQELA